MSLTGKHVDISHIIERVYRDNGFDLEIKYDEVIEWTWDVISLIGAPKTFVDKVTDGSQGMPQPIIIENYRGNLPVDLHSVYLARDYDTKMPMILKGTTYLRDNEQLFVKESQYTYTLNDSYIFTSFEEGEVELHYKAFPTNNLGMPLVPDDIKFVMATQSYIAERIGLRLWMQDHISKQKYDKLESERLWYIGAAQTRGVTPSIDELEGMKNRYLRLRIHPDLHDTSFIYSMEKERLILHNNAGR
ncbi:hypothetical protein LCGC14_2621060 [marine sediment metagenome]|uniref:Uncharacterized protein n=1 Tax=marine sediment metagenome TaxID=412755 RepID=A0A0F9A2Z8_9ZZZZ